MAEAEKEMFAPRPSADERLHSLATYIQRQAVLISEEFEPLTFDPKPLPVPAPNKCPIDRIEVAARNLDRLRAAIIKMAYE